jgi:hypothetical protein
VPPEASVKLVPPTTLEFIFKVPFTVVEVAEILLNILYTPLTFKVPKRIVPDPEIVSKGPANIVLIGVEEGITPFTTTLPLMVHVPVYVEPVKDTPFPTNKLPLIVVALEPPGVGAQVPEVLSKRRCPKVRLLIETAVDKELLPRYMKVEFAFLVTLAIFETEVVVL